MKSLPWLLFGLALLLASVPCAMPWALGPLAATMQGLGAVALGGAGAYSVAYGLGRFEERPKPWSVAVYHDWTWIRRRKR